MIAWDVPRTGLYALLSIALASAYITHNLPPHEFLSLTDTGMNVRVACPVGYDPDPEVMASVKGHAEVCAYCIALKEKGKRRGVVVFVEGGVSDRWNWRGEKKRSAFLERRSDCYMHLMNPVPSSVHSHSVNRSVDTCTTAERGHADHDAQADGGGEGGARRCD